MMMSVSALVWLEYLFVCGIGCDDFAGPSVGLVSTLLW